MKTDPRDLRIAELEHAVAMRDTAVATLQETVTILLARIEDLESRLNRNSSNSSTPPSANPPGAPKTTSKKSSERKPGGQPGHKGTHRAVVDNPDRVVPHLPRACQHCQADFSGNETMVGKPVRHQVTDLPPILPVVIEHQLNRCRCENCGKTTRAELPVGVGQGQFGPRLTAFVAMLSGRYRLTRRELSSVLGDAFGLRLSVGSVQALCEQAAHALATPFQEVAEEVLAEPVVHPDETGWRHRGKKAWLWTVSSRKAAVFKLHRGRGHEARRVILPDDYSGVVVSDRWATYTPFERRGICHAHLLRNWRAISERKHPGAKAAGAWGVAETERMLRLHREYRDGVLSRDGLRLRMRLVKARYAKMLDMAEECGDPKAKTLALELNRLWKHLWTFVEMEGVDPTNNEAEQTIRPAVLWRKGSFGTWSEMGQRFTERSLTIAATTRKQGVSLFDFLFQAIDARLHQLPAPSIFSFNQVPNLAPRLYPALSLPLPT